MNCAQLIISHTCCFPHTRTHAHHTACNCNGHSNKCFFDRHLYNLTEHGGHCIDCQRNRDGPNCERCKENFVMRSDGYCINCDCDPVGTFVQDSECTPSIHV